MTRSPTFITAAINSAAGTMSFGWKKWLGTTGTTRHQLSPLMRRPGNCFLLEVALLSFRRENWHCFSPWEFDLFSDKKIRHRLSYLWGGDFCLSVSWQKTLLRDIFAPFGGFLTTKFSAYRRLLARMAHRRAFLCSCKPVYIYRFLREIQCLAFFSGDVGG